MAGSSDLHEQSRKYWSSVSTSYLGTKGYYDAQEDALRSVLAKHGPFGAAVDLGCGDGRFTMVAAGHCRTILGVDLNPTLIWQARERVPAHEGARIGFRVEAVDTQVQLGQYDLVMCLGVTSCLISPEAFANAVGLVRACSRPGGTVLLKDTLSRDAEIVNRSGDYVAMYRNRDGYLAAFAAAGLRQEGEVVLSETPETVNALMLFRVAAA